jgi:hypothetical protein
VNSVKEYKKFIHEFFSWIALNGFKAYAGTQSRYSRKEKYELPCVDFHDKLTDARPQYVQICYTEFKTQTGE